MHSQAWSFDPKTTGNPSETLQKANKETNALLFVQSLPLPLIMVSDKTVLQISKMQQVRLV